ncbi:TPA: hypothetical protein ACKP5P_002785 [Stenotrophomonas maltophilia]|uniref:hypothetical protein n=1 Tax=Stenotrophomonas TaxID=40323 RepID=UPI0013DD78CF|nr:MULTISPECIES: hypothetical protein [Stenotrophomonas]MDG9988892.1 hypothetical protein [Stenotrophomonas sp. GD04024]
MIKINRSTITIPDCLRTDIASDGSSETQLAIDYFEGNDRENGFTYKVYSKTEVKSRLKKLFNNKCGFCEIDYGGAASDVEHFRPKGRLDTIDERGKVKISGDGYYWLGADWSNLIYSCQHCNRGETHIHAGDFPETENSVRVSGKRNLFPLIDESKRISRGSPINSEEPYRLLLDPCNDDPTLHLEFDNEGHVYARKVGSNRSAKGRNSIEIYGLRRDPLNARRKLTATMLLYSVSTLNDATLASLRALNDHSLRSKVVDHVSHIQHNFLASHCPFLAMSRGIAVKNIDFASLRKCLNR